MSATRRWWGLIAKLVFSALLLAWLLSTHLSLAEIRAALAAPRWPWLLAALAAYGLSAVGGAVQWLWLLRAGGVTAPRAEVHRLYQVGLFFNNFLPANLGGDAVKIFNLGRQEGRPLKVFCATLLDRVVGLTGLTLLALAAAGLVAVRTATLPPFYPLVVALLAWLALLTLLLSRRVSSRLPGLLRRVRAAALAAKMEAALGEFALYRPRIRWFLGLLAFSIGVQGLRVATHLLAAAGLGLSLSPAQGLQLFVLVPLLGILVALPVSINGIGLRESVTALMFTSVGLSRADAVAMELMAFLMQVAWSLVGGMLFLRGRRRARAGAKALA